MRRADASPGARAPLTIRGACALALALALPSRPEAQPIGGTLSGQWQSVEERALMRMPDGSLRDSTFRRTFWSQSYEILHSARLADAFHISSQLQYLDQSYTARPHARRAGGATLRVGHPHFGVTASYRPTLLTTTPVSLGVPGLAPVYRTQKTWITETLLAGNLAAPGLPQLDVAWARQHHESDARAVEDATVTRRANVAYTLGPLDLRAGYGDQGRDSTGGNRPLIERWNANAGAAVNLAPTPATSLGMQYEFSNYRTGAQAPGGLVTRMHAGSLAGSYRVSERAGWNLAYSYRRTQLLNHVENRFSNHDGSVLFRYVPSPVANFHVAGGVNTLNASTAPQVERFVTAAATATGKVRTAWSGSGSASHSTNWDRSGRPYSIETLRLGSVFRGSRDVQVGVDLSASLNSNRAQSIGPVSSEAAISASAAPLRSIRLFYGSRIARSGRSLLHPNARSGNRSFTLRWMPGRRLSLDGALDKSEAGGLVRTGTTTRRAQLHLQGGARTRLSASYSRSDNASQQAGTSQLVGREVYAAEFTYGFGRGWTLRADTYQVDPRSRNASHQYDAGLTWSFGR